MTHLNKYWSLVLLGAAALLALGALGCKDTGTLGGGGGGVCSPGTVECVMGQAMMCNRDGTGLELYEDCMGKRCLPGVGCEGSDLNPGNGGGNGSGDNGGGGGNSNAGAKRCNGDTVEVFDGLDTWLPGTSCASRNQRCENGECVGCQPNTRVCLNERQVALCGADGVSTTPIEMCDDGRLCHAGACVTECELSDGKLSYMGCEYWAVDLRNVAHPEAQFAVVVSNTKNSEVTVRVSAVEGGSPQEIKRVIIPPNQLEIIELPKEVRNIPDTLKDRFAYRINAEMPVIAYQFNPLNNSDDTYSNDASLLIPTEALDREYIAIAGDAIIGGEWYENWGATITVVGVTPSPTNVTITMPDGLRFEAPQGATVSGQTITASLVEYEVLNIMSLADDTGAAGDGNLSGAKISADAAVAVFAGNAATVVPQGPGQTCCADHLEEQMVPTSTWGKNYIGGMSYQRVQRGTPIPDYWRVTALQDNTTLTYAPTPPAGAPTSLNAGESVEFKSATDFSVSGDKPISLVQFLTSSYQSSPGANPGLGAITCSGETEAQDLGCTSNTGYLSNCTEFEGYFGPEFYCTPLGDPSMIVVPPVEQYRNDYIFLTPLDYQMDFITLIAPVGSNITLDGTPVTTQGWVSAGTVGETQYERLAMQVGRGVHKLVSDKPVGLIVYGMDRDVSYGYPAGLDLTRLNIR